jgi:hypothetical protein
MLRRRDALALGAAGLMTGLVRIPGVSASPEVPPGARLETRLFNFKDDVSATRIDEAVGSLRELAHTSGIAGLTVGRNLDATAFSTRFEWIYMVQVNATLPHGVISFPEGFQRWKEALASMCRNQVECDLRCPLPNGFADAPGVKVRHTVMFDFKPEATAEARDRNVAAIRRMGQLPMVQHYLVERTAARAPGAIEMEWQVVGDFASLDDYRAYSEAPVHLAIREDFTAQTSRVAWLDVRIAA